jgi:predicted XRE-type DNA-binding protein
MTQQRFASIWDALEDTPEAAENMKRRSSLMMALRNHLLKAEMSQAEVASLFGVTQPRVSDLKHGKIDLFGLDALVNMAASAGLHIETQITAAKYRRV